MLETLSKKEAVQPISENPVRYIAVAPDILFERIADSTEQRCRRVTEGLRALSNVPKQEYVWSITGTETIRARIDRMIDEARGHLWIKTSDTNLVPHHEAMRRASERGIEIVVILYGSETAPFEYGGSSRVWLHEGNGIPVGIAPYLVTITRDYEEALVAEFNDEAHGSYTRNAQLVNMADTLIRHEIYIAEIFDAFGKEIQGRFGTALFDLRQKYLPASQVKDLKKRISTQALRMG